MLRKTEAKEQMARELEKRQEQLSDPASRLAMLVAAGELIVQAKGSWQEAERLLKRALALSPRHPMARMALFALYGSQAQPAAICTFLEEELSAVPTEEERLRLYGQLGEMYLLHQDFAQARLAFEHLLEGDPSSLAALRFLQQDCLRRDQFATFGRLKVKELALSPSPEERHALWLDFARYVNLHPFSPASAENQMKDDVAASEKPPTVKQAYLAALEAQPHSLLCLRRLADIAWGEKDWLTLAQLWERMATETAIPSESAIFFTRVAELSEERKIDFCQQALQQKPDFLPAICQLKFASLRRQDWPNAVFAAEEEYKYSTVKAHKYEAALLAGEGALTALADQQRGINAYQHVLAIDPENRVAWEKLRELFVSQEKWQELADLLSHQAKFETSEQKLIELHEKIAELAEHQLKDKELAKQHYRELIKHDPLNEKALSCLSTLYLADEQWSEAAHVLLHRGRKEENPAKLIELFLQLGRIFHEKTPDKTRAIISFKKVLTLDEGNLEALECLSQLYNDNFDYKQALATNTILSNREKDPQKKVIYLLKNAKIQEEGLKDPHQTAIIHRQALELAPENLEVIGEVVRYFERKGDAHSLMIHMDRSVATMRTRVRKDPLDAGAYSALFKIFGWRKLTDGCFCAAQALEALGQLNREQGEFLEKNRTSIGDPGPALADIEYDEFLFQRSIPGGFRQVFRQLSKDLSRLFLIMDYGVKKSDRITDPQHPYRRLGDPLAKQFAVNYELYALRAEPTSIIVRNTDTPAILLGEAFLQKPIPEEISFLLGRSFWIIRSAMFLPAALPPQDITMLIASIIRQYNPEYQPDGIDPIALLDYTKRLARVIPRKLRQDLEPFVLECLTMEQPLIGPAIIHSANHAGLLTSRSLVGALIPLLKLAGQAQPPQNPEEQLSHLQTNEQAKELLNFSVSDAYLELRRTMKIALR
jgi:hypothetical protein